MFCRFRNNERGATAVEFALVLPFVISTIMGMMEFGCIFLTLMSAEIATGDVSRQLAANHITSSRVQALIVARLPGWVRAQASALTITPVQSGTSPVVWTITTTIPMKTATPTNFFGAIYGSRNLTVNSVRQQEPTS
jgi:Flp pilus assembly pilin Flp